MSKSVKATKGKGKDIPPSEGNAIPVAIKKATEMWSETELEDGTIIRLRPVVVEVVREKNRYTEDGSPVYVIKSGMIIDTKSPSHLKKG